MKIDIISRNDYLTDQQKNELLRKKVNELTERVNQLTTMVLDSNERLFNVESNYVKRPRREIVNPYNLRR